MFETVDMYSYNSTRVESIVNFSINGNIYPNVFTATYYLQLFPQLESLDSKSFGTWTSFAKRYCNARHQFFGRQRRWVTEYVKLVLIHLD